ncbi:hypothetical protein TRIUR3_18408 [Triticum urartu]|uniref:Uncharacterized protein n=1 Tax=Triticum urartu TaxID=4572 RepID=M7YS83_TRIUA|nr:hypothetical protein TRIUR3_18408 [Triticum urartu]
MGHSGREEAGHGRYPSTALRDRAQEVLDDGSVGCLMLVSGREELPPLLRLAKEKGVRSVVVGGESGLARWSDTGFTWAEVIAGKARKAAPSMSGKWRDRDVLKRLEWRYEDDDEEDVVFEEDGDGVSLPHDVTEEEWPEAVPDLEEEWPDALVDLEERESADSVADCDEESDDTVFRISQGTRKLVVLSVGLEQPRSSLFYCNK